jgi:hypothetical protein
VANGLSANSILRIMHWISWIVLVAGITLSKYIMNEQVIELVKAILESDLPISTRDKIVRHYMLPQLGRTQAIIQDTKAHIEIVNRPSVEDIEIEENPEMKAEFAQTERGLTGHTDLDDEEEDE